MFSMFVVAMTQTKLVDRTVMISNDKGYSTYVASAYSLRGRMASGRYVYDGAIAADPRFLKIGTRVEIKGLGNFTVHDTGGAIKGRRIDIWMPSTAKALRFGRRKVELRIL
jgi:3D (Asp-Asp-Asp) domain-containing protein